MYNIDQLLFEHCTAKFSDNTQCCVPVFDICHELPLCFEHGKKHVSNFFFPFNIYNWINTLLCDYKFLEWFIQWIFKCNLFTFMHKIILVKQLKKRLTYIEQRVIFL